MAQTAGVIGCRAGLCSSLEPALRVAPWGQGPGCYPLPGARGGQLSQAHATSALSPRGVYAELAHSGPDMSFSAVKAEPLDAQLARGAERSRCSS